MAEIMDVLDNMIKRELNNASNYVTRSTIKMRVLLNVMKTLDLSLQSIYDTKNLIHVDISCSTAIEKSWMESCGNNVSADEWAVLERFLAKDFVRNIDLMRLATVLTKKISKKDLYCIFAVDGLATSENDDSLKNYFDNLTIPMEFGERNHEELDEESMKNCHARAIRTIHKYITTADNECLVVVTPEILGNVLKKIFDIDNNPTVIKNDSSKGADIYSNSDNSSISGDDDDENNDLERHIGDMYKRLVGVKLYAIASWKKSEYIQRQATLNNSGTLKNKRSRKPSKKVDEPKEKKLKTENQEENE